ncbi:MAG: universal stress protein [Bdellovibrionales bacterium]|nr:universal stress protein [Bdellovibrionales bacterium]
MSEIRKCNVILALDPFEKGLEPSTIALKELKAWGRKLGPHVEAVHVIDESDQNPGFNQIYTRAYDLLHERVRKMNLGVPIRVKVIWEHGDLLQHPAHTLVDYARESRADLILVSSHGRKWLSRMVLGSFAEKVLIASPVPVLFFGRSPDAQDTWKRVLFATDFSEASRLAFLKFIRQIRPINPEVVILHVAEYPNFVTGMSLAGVGAYLPEAYWKVMKESLISEGEAWVGLAEKESIRARAIIEEGSGDVSLAIQRAAAMEHASLIGLASTRPELHKIVMGSVSNRIFRSPFHSVWVCGPKAFESFAMGQPVTQEQSSPIDGTKNASPP